MTVKGFTGGEKVEAVLRDLASKVTRPGTLRVGFLENSTYPDGTSVPMVAAIQEFGAPAAGIPPRPFFRNMIKEKSPDWGKALGGLVRDAGYDATTALGQMGEGIKGQLEQSIVETTEPALSPITLMLRKMRAADPNLVVGGKIVGEAAARVKAGESTSGVSTKPLVDSGHLLGSVGSEVKS